MEIDVRITETKKELEIIEGLVKENGHLHTVVGTANEILSKKAQEMGLNVADIINESKHQNRSEFEANLLDPMTSTIVTEKLNEKLMNN